HLADLREHVATNAQQFPEHLDGVTHRIDFATLPMEGLNRDLLDAVVEQTADEQDLRIEAPVLDLLQSKNALCRVAGESFETTLRVLEIQAEQGLHHAPKGCAADSAI